MTGTVGGPVVTARSRCSRGDGRGGDGTVFFQHDGLGNGVEAGNTNGEFNHWVKHPPMPDIDTYDQRCLQVVVGWVDGNGNLPNGNPAQFPGDTVFRWDDMECDRQSRYICEYCDDIPPPLPPAPPPPPPPPQHGVLTCEAGFKPDAKQTECVSCTVAGEYLSSDGNQCVVSCRSGEFRSVLYSHIFDGECGEEGDEHAGELRMYEGSDDNPGTDHASRLNACAQACKNKKTPLNDATWTGFEALGFILTDEGRCYCERQPSYKCTRPFDTGYMRYDLNNVCATTCPDDEFAPSTDDGTGQCAASCPSGEYRPSSGNVCVQTCPDGEFRSRNTNDGRGQCVVSCPNGEFKPSTGNICVTTCPDNEFAPSTDDGSGQCAASCPSGEFRPSSDFCSQGVGYPRGISAGDACCAGTCGTCGGSGCGYRSGGAANCCSRVISKHKICKSATEVACVIPDATPPPSADGGGNVCVTMCPIGHFAPSTDDGTGQCARHCPSGEYRPSSGNVCVKTCPDNEFAPSTDDGTGQCATSCPSEEIRPSSGNVCTVLTCAAGFEPDTAQVECVQCESGTINSNETGGSCTPCGLGQTSNDARSECILDSALIGGLVGGLLALSCCIVAIVHCCQSGRRVRRGLGKLKAKDRLKNTTSFHHVESVRQIGLEDDDYGLGLGLAQTIQDDNTDRRRAATVMSVADEEIDADLLGLDDSHDSDLCGNTL